MTNCTCVTASFLVLSACVAAQTTAEDTIASRDRLRHLYNLRIAAARVREVFDRTNNDRELDEAMNNHLEQRISQSTREHRIAQESRPLCEEHAKRWLSERLERGWREQVAWAARQSPPVSEKELRDELGFDVDDRIRQACQEYLVRRFADVFEAARNRAVNAQAGELRNRLNIELPAKKKIDRFLVEQNVKNQDAPWENIQPKLMELMRAAAVPSGVVVFEENSKDIDRRIVDRLAGVKVAYDEQLKLIKNAESSGKVPPTKVVAPQIGDFLMGALKELAEKQRHVYGVFEVAKERAGKAAKEIEHSRLRAFVAQWNPPITQSLLEGEIERNAKQHRESGLSREYFLQNLPGRLATDLVAAYLRPAGHATVLGEQSRLAETLSKDTVLRQTLQKRITEVLDRELPSARGAIAKRQAAPCLEALRGGWWPSVKLVNYRQEHQDRRLPGSLADARELMDLEEAGNRIDFSPLQREPVLDEADQLVVKALVNKLRAGDSAMTKQLNLVQELDRSRAGELEARVNDGWTVEMLLAKWTTMLKSAWEMHIEQMPPPTRSTGAHNTGNDQAALAVGAANHYRDLFPAAQHELNKVVRQRFDEVRERLAAKDAGPARPLPAESLHQHKDDGTSLPRTDASDPHHRVGRSSSKKASGDASGDGTEGRGSNGPGPGGGGPSASRKDRQGKGGGDGVPPDVSVILADAQGHIQWCTATVRLLPPHRQQSDQKPPLDFDPTDGASATKIVDLMWGDVAEAARNKIRSQEQTGEHQPGPIEVVVLVQVESEKIRHRMSIQVREGLRRRLREEKWAMPSGLDRTSVVLQWVDILGPTDPAKAP